MTGPPSIPDLEAALSGLEVEVVYLPPSPFAVVAIIFRKTENGLSLCIGQRAAHDADPWSGDMAFPGGKSEPDDLTLHDVAARETFEEVGLSLNAEMLIGSMEEVRANRGARRAPLKVFPLVYLMDGSPPPFVLSEEFDAAYWVELDYLWDRANWMSFEYKQEKRFYSGIRLADHYIWGFTLRVLVKLSEDMGCPLTGYLRDDEIAYFMGEII